jgi:hypothetical protein
MSKRFDPEEIKRAVVSPRWSGLVRADLSAEAISRWDKSLLRDTRVLVPIDVQALYVPPGDETQYVRLPFALTTPDGQPPEAMPAPFAAGERRPAGVHLHWAPPDSLLRGRLARVAEGSLNRLALPALPDRWVVLRVVAPQRGTRPLIKGWVLEADTAKAIPLEQYPAARDSATPAGKTVPPEQLTGTVGGTLNWAGVYDAVTNRLSFHDPLDDLAESAPNGVVADLAVYVVSGWWSNPRLDPLDGANTSASLAVRLKELSWSLVSDAEGGDQLNYELKTKSLRRDSIGLNTARRFDAPDLSGGRAPTPGQRSMSDELKLTQAFTPAVSRLVADAVGVVGTEPRWPRATLLEGSVHGVPVRGPVVTDLRPSADSVDVTLGRHGDDVAAALAAAGLGAESNDKRRSIERLLSAFTGQVLSKLGTEDGVVLAEEHEHEAAFASRHGGEGPVERLRAGADAGPLNVGRAARGEMARQRGKSGGVRATTFSKLASSRTELIRASVFEQRGVVEEWTGRRPPTEAKTEVREVRRPAPRFHFPLDPLIAVRGIKRSLRHRGDGRFSPDGKLHSRWPSQVQTKLEGVIDGADYVPSLPSGAIPDEVLTLVRNAVVDSPYLVPWLTRVEAERRQLDREIVGARLQSEAAFRYGRDAVYDGGTDAFNLAADTTLAADIAGRSFVQRTQVADELRRFSLYAGVDADPVGKTLWAQPWVPLWLEWHVGIQADDRLDGWRLAQIDFEAAETRPVSSRHEWRGRTPLHTGTARTLAGAIEEWLKLEEQRDTNNQGEVDDETAKALHKVANHIGSLDVLAATLDGFKEHLLGLPVDEFGVLLRRNSDDTLNRPAPVAAPQLLLSGVLRLLRARVVDAFGRTLDLPVGRLRIPARDEAAAAPPTLLLRPRLLRPARWLFRLVDPSLASLTPGAASAEGGPAEATIDEIDPSRMINPVAGFILPDHMDEALEVFDTAGRPLGQLMHEPFGGGVVWEIAPGRTGPSDAGPNFDLAPQQQLLGLMATGMVAADARERAGEAAGSEQESALSAFLRAVDTTLWTVDTFAHLGTEHIAGLIGRPVAVVRATLRLDISDDLEELDLSAAGARAEREAAYRALADRAFPVRLGELTRSDDGLLGFFVDDDYTRFHVVDKVVRDGALDVRRGRGQFDQIGRAQQVPDVLPIEHPYVVAEDELFVRPGQVLRLTLLLHPAARVHLTSGLLPRKYLQLARDWVHPGLSVMSPSVRVGPVIVDADTIRLPKVSSFPKDQIWTRRDTPSTWKDDPILAATQTALFPDTPSEVQEGYIRVAPGPAPGGGES